jgi:hypothetical protein
MFSIPPPPPIWIKFRVRDVHVVLSRIFFLIRENQHIQGRTFIRGVREVTFSCDESALVSTRWFKYDRDYLCINKSQFAPVIFEPPCTLHWVTKFILSTPYFIFHFFVKVEVFSPYEVFYQI